MRALDRIKRDIVPGENDNDSILLVIRKYEELLSWGERVVAHCERMNFNTREEEWIAEELEEIRRELEEDV